MERIQYFIKVLFITTLCLGDWFVIVKYFFNYFFLFNGYRHLTQSWYFESPLWLWLLSCFIGVKVSGRGVIDAL